MTHLSKIFDRLSSVSPDGDGVVARCPAHQDSHASLRVAVSSEGNVILKCRAGCDSSAVVEAMGLQWADFFGVDNDVPSVEATHAGTGPVPVKDQAQMAAYLFRARGGPDEARQYALRRFGVDGALYDALGLGHDPGGQYAIPYGGVGAVYHQVPRLVVPFYDQAGIPRGFQSRAMADHHVRWAGPTNPEEGGSWSKIGFFQSGSGTDFVVVTEGPGDGLTSVAAGVDSVLIRGAALASGVAEEIADALNGRRVVLAGDNDRAGGDMNVALAGRLHALGVDVRVLHLPDGMEDLSAWFEADPVNFHHSFQEAVFQAPKFTPPMKEEEKKEETYDTTDLGVARMVRDFFEGRLAYTPGLGFFIYEGGVWKKDQLNLTRATVHKLSDILAERAEKMSERDQLDGKDKHLLRASKRLRSTFVIDQVLKELQTLTAVPLERYDQHHHLLAVANGVVDLRKGTLLPHSMDYYLTQKVEVEFNPEAKAPRWEAFLKEVFPGDVTNLPPYIQRLVGYGITGETDEQCFAILWGRGANGKSVFTDTLSFVFEGISTTTPFSTFEEKMSGGIPNDLAALRGSRLVFASEGEASKRMAESVIKRVTGQDLISARFMREEFFSFRPTFLILLATNHKPSFRSADDGLWRRVKMVPWSRFFAPEERDHRLTRKLREEAEGVLSWAVAGAVYWYAHGLQDPATVVTATKGYRDTSDALSGFFGDILVESRGDVVDGADAYRSYIEWTEREELPSKEVWSRKALYQGLEERGVDRVKRKTGQVLLDVKLVDPLREDVDMETPFEGSR